eukprot:38302-Amphidinium_carterae.1
MHGLVLALLSLLALLSTYLPMCAGSPHSRHIALHHHSLRGCGRHINSIVACAPLLPVVGRLGSMMKSPSGAIAFLGVAPPLSRVRRPDLLA